MFLNFVYISHFDTFDIYFHISIIKKIIYEQTTVKYLIGFEVFCLIEFFLTE